MRRLLALSLVCILSMALSLGITSRFPHITYADEATTATFGNPIIREPLNWTRFWQVFNTHSAWDLEANVGTGWFSVKTDLQIIRDYPNEWTCKITLNFTSSYAGDYRLTFAVDKHVKTFLQKNASRYELNYEDYSVYFDWSDLLSVAQLQFSHGITQLEGKDVFWFRIRRDNIPKGIHFSLDPTFGSTQAGSKSYRIFNNDMHGSVFTSPADANGYAVSISFYGKSVPWYSYMKAVLVNHTSLHIVEDGVGAPILVSQDGAWYTSIFDPQPTLSASTDYVLMMIPGDGAYFNYETGAANQGHHDTSNSYNNPNHPVDASHTNFNFSIYCTYAIGSSNSAPSIGEFTAPNTVHGEEWFDLSCRVADAEGYGQFVNATVELSDNIILKWDSGTDVFSKQQDPNGYCNLNAESSQKSIMNSTSYLLTWVIKLANDCPEGSKSIISTNTLVYDTRGDNGTGSQSGLFTFQHVPSQQEETGGGGGGGAPPSPPTEPPITPPVTPPLPPAEAPSANLVLLGAGCITFIVVVSAVTQKRKRGLSSSRRSWRRSRAKTRNPKFPKSRPKRVKRKKESSWKWERK